MGVFRWFSYRSPRQEKREARKYDKWAFPYGEAQQGEVQRLLQELLPGEVPRIAMARYLIGREGYLGDYDEAPEDREGVTRQDSRRSAAVLLRRQVSCATDQELGLYLALIEADAAVDETLTYPTADQLRAAGRELARWIGEHKHELR